MTARADFKVFITFFATAIYWPSLSNTDRPISSASEALKVGFWTIGRIAGSAAGWRALGA
jgi:hypothetical protein